MAGAVVLLLLEEPSLAETVCIGHGVHGACAQSGAAKGFSCNLSRWPGRIHSEGVAYQ